MTFFYRIETQFTVKHTNNTHAYNELKHIAKWNLFPY